MKYTNTIPLKRLVFFCLCLIMINLLYADTQRNYCKIIRKQIKECPRCVLIKLDSIADKIPQDSIKLIIYNYLSRYYALSKLQKTDSAIDVLDKMIAIHKQKKDTISAAYLYRLKALEYEYQNQYHLAIQNYLKALPGIYKDKNYNYVGGVYNNLALMYMYWGNHNKVVYYYQKAIKNFKKNKDSVYIAMASANLGFEYALHNEFDSALYYHNIAYNLYLALNHKSGIAKEYHGLGECYLGKMQYKIAIDMFTKAMNERKALNQEFAAAQSELFLGYAMVKNKNENRGIEIMQNTINKIETYKNPRWTSRSSKMIAEALAIANQWKMAYLYSIKYLQIKDSVFTEKIHRQIAESQTIFETKEKEKQIVQLQKNETIIKHKIQQQNQLLIYSIVSLTIFLILSIFLYRSILNKKKANKKIESQKQYIEKQHESLKQKNKEITDSISYAGYIQKAILPNENFNNIGIKTFTYFRPKDIVSGDFYYFNKINNWYLAAVADCTGHGVPGALMSMMGVAFINEIVQKKEVNTAADVLNYLREKIIAALHQNNISKGIDHCNTNNNPKMKDGMDIALVAIDLKSNICHFAGANNPLYVYRNGNLIEYKPDKMPIAIYDRMQPFANQTFNIEHQDELIMFSDGYADQYGGINNKKMKRKRFKDILSKTILLSFSEQEKFLNKAFLDWKKDIEQIDDVCVMGIYFDKK